MPMTFSNVDLPQPEGPMIATRLAATGGPHDRDEFLLLDLQVDAVQSNGLDFVCLVDLEKIVQLEHVFPLVRKVESKRLIGVEHQPVHIGEACVR
jgi:hypothetical protein